MDGKALVDSVRKEIIEPGIQRLMDTPYFTELRQGKLSDQAHAGLGDPALSTQQSDPQILRVGHGQERPGPGDVRLLHLPIHRGTDPIPIWRNASAWL